ncbi:MAG: Cell filamentation protein Fic [uncultured Sulfurovum sp.]|uniref:Cell filamentation protein Fic n=1 Tax=uncultured Sulfurovum sp. TaxID=269237 RepID=A0A6S6U8K2_9BACT|nr:MAG: Cell filamentation protein Fic [uncultured Sulfurovum sp.]
MKLSQLSLREKEALFRELRISITHHSNAMEGTTLSFGETKELLANGSTAGGKPLSEQLVILGFAKAYDVVVREASNPSFKMTASFIKDLHYIMFEDALQVSSAFIEKPIGAYRLDERYIKGVDIKLSAPAKIAQDIENLLYQYDKSVLSLEEMASFHIKFEQIHPFTDGNGRVGRLLMAFQYIQNDLIPPLILNDNRREYFDALLQSSLLKEFLAMSCNESLKLIEVK